MADNRYGGEGRREGWRGRDDSIFTDDDDRWSRGSGRWPGEHGRERGAGRDDDRGFFERAGDELRSWFGDEEAERRREADSRHDEGRGDVGGRGHDRGFEGVRSFYGSGDSGVRGRFGREPGGQRGFGGGRSPWDDNYRQWRDRQIRQFDSEYEDYCRERQQQFEQDFDSWRGSRLTEGGTSGKFGGASSGETLEAPGGGRSAASGRSQSGASGTAGALGAETAAAGSAAEPGTGGSGGGRGGRPRS